MIRMWRTLGISQTDWQHTPTAVKTVLLGLHHQAHSDQLRALGYQKQLQLHTDPAAQLAALRQQIARQKKLLTGLQREIRAASRLSAEIARLKAENANLTERLGQNSSNSSLPPSSDPPFLKRANNRQLSGRKQGAQSGHAGVGRWLLDSDELDEVIELRPGTCQRCGGVDFEPADWFLPARRQVTEITASGTVVTEYQRPALRCSGCGRRNRAAWPAEAESGAFGSRVKAIIGYLTGRLNLSHRDTVEAMQELFKVRISLGSISAVQKRISAALARPVEIITEFVTQQPVAYVDETGWREKERRPWLWVASTSQATVFQVLPGRRTSDAQTMIGESGKGVITTDRYAGYNWLEAYRRQICWAHLKRNFTAIAERDEADSKAIGAGLLKQTKRLFELWHRMRDGTLQRAAFLTLIEPIRQRVSELLIEGVISVHPKTRNFCRNLLKLEYSLWTFTRVDQVEPTNNQAERALRRAVLWRRKAFGTQSESGSRFVERILTVVATLRQQGRSVLDYLQKADLAINLGRTKQIPELQSGERQVFNGSFFLME